VYSAYMGSGAGKLIEDTIFLRIMQFVDDSGPMAYPVRTDTYMEIANVSADTIYAKGAEVVRMMSILRR